MLPYINFTEATEHEQMMYTIVF